MVASIGSTSNNIDLDLKKLASGFQAGIQAEIDKASEPIKRIQTQRDTIDVRRGVFTDMKTNFDALQSAVQALISTQATFGLKLTAKPNVTPGLAGASVLTATTKESAAAADYDISVTQLAKAQSRATDPFAGADMALGKNGILWLGGNGSPASLSGFTPSDALTAATTATVATGQHELGTGDYSLQTRISDGVRQFRLVNADGTAVSIQKTGGSGYTDAWQAAKSGSFDTGRGLSVTLNSSGTTGSTALSYSAMGTSINISSTDTLRSITASINAANQPEGRAMRASIIGNKLVITAAQTGINHPMIYTDSAGLGFGADLQPAQNAVFKVNGLEISRSVNTNLTDVIDGTTLNLSGDAEGKTARLSITGSTDTASAAMNTLVTTFNTAFTHLTNKMAITSKSDGAKTTYTRGPLTGDVFFKGLRTDLYNQVSRKYANSGSFTNLSDIGLNLDKDMKLTLDATKFSEAMKSHPSDVTALLDTAMGGFNTLVSRQTGTSGMLQTSVTSLESQIKDYNSRIAKKNDSLTMFKKSLYDKYLNYQITLADIGYQAQMFGIDLSA